MTSDMRLRLAQSFRTSRSSFTSNNGYESPSLNPASVSNGEEYDSDGSNFAPPSPSSLSMVVPPELAGAIPLIDKFQVESLTNQEEVEIRAKIEALGLEVTKVPSKSMQNLDELEIAKELDELQSWMMWMR